MYENIPKFSLQFYYNLYIESCGQNIFSLDINLSLGGEGKPGDI